MSQAKPFCISRWTVWEAWKRVRANQGAPGLDETTIADFEVDLKDNLYKIWNRMSSGSYFPSPVRLVDIPKPGGGVRTLGIPTVADRVAQMVVKLTLEPEVDPIFHEDSYGYRPNKSALEAVGTARRRCWKRDWVVDLDIKGFFDNIDHRLMMRALRKHTGCRWILLYVERWLTAPAVGEDGQLIERTRGTPQGGVISPLLANIFLHHAFDSWMAETYPTIPFERYADDIIVHCRTQRQARSIRDAIRERLTRCRLRVHPEKTKLVYCQDSRRRGRFEQVSFDFLGFAFRPRRARSRYGFFVGFLPGISQRAAKAIRQQMRRWALHRWSDKSLSELARMVGAKLRGWLNYFGRYYRSALVPVFEAFNQRLVRWAQRKYKRYRHRPRQAALWLRRIAKREPELFPHWQIGALP